MQHDYFPSSLDQEKNKKNPKKHHRTIIDLRFIQHFCPFACLPLTVSNGCGRAMEHTRVKRQRIISEVTQDARTPNMASVPHEDHVYRCAHTHTHARIISRRGIWVPKGMLMQAD